MPYSIGQRVCDLRVIGNSSHAFISPPRPAGYCPVMWTVSAVNNSSVDVTTPTGLSLTIPTEYIVTEDEVDFAF
jgi:hypothetical protein